MADGGFISHAAKAKRPIRAADLFCGSGGFSTGLVRAVERLFPGRQLDLVAVNHWQVAIDTHQLNHPSVRHFCADLEHLKPLEAVPGGVLDILLAAPACTYHSRARGGKPVNDQQRVDPWHVVRWCSELRVHRLIVENVPEFMDWGPCDVRSGKPIKSRKGEYFRAWCNALKAIGFRGEWKVLRCAGFGDATTRERFFFYARSDKKALHWPIPEYTRGGETDLLGTMKPWRSAAEIIDWERLGTSIFTRKKALVKNTLSRLLAGAKRNYWPQQHIDALQALVDGKEPRLLVSAEEAEAIARQLGVPLVMATGAGGVARGVDQPLPTVTAGGDGGATPHFARPLLMGVGSSNGAKPVTDPCPTITTGGASAEKRPGNARPQLASAIILHKMNSTGGRSSRGVDEPVPTVTTNGAGAIAKPIITPYYGGGSGLTGKGVDEPLPAQGTKDRFSLASPTLIRAGHGDDGHNPLGRVLDPDVPLPTVTGSNEIGIARAFLVPNFGERPGQEPRTHAIDEPAPAITASGHIQLATPFIAPCTHHDASARERPISEPLPTVTGANRGELALASPAIVEGYYIDILYRMLHWSELARATSFEDGAHTYQFTGTSTEITKQIGNAVPVRTATELCAALLAGA